MWDRCCLVRVAGCVGVDGGDDNDDDDGDDGDDGDDVGAQQLPSLIGTYALYDAHARSMLRRSMGATAAPLRMTMVIVDGRCDAECWRALTAGGPMCRPLRGWHLAVSVRHPTFGI